MRTALQDEKVPAAQKSKIVTMQPPTGGWNARDSLPSMPPTDAVQLTDVLCWPSDIRTRLGSVNYSTGYGAPVNTLMSFNSATAGSMRLFAASGASIYDATAGGAIGAPVVTGLASSKWQYVNFATSAGQFLCTVNGADSYYTYNGAAWTPTATMAITGGGTLNMNTVINLGIYQSTLYFVPANTLGFYYLPAQQITGTVTYFNLAALCRRGGHLVAVDNWTVDGGQGPQDYFVAITSEGEVVIFQGSAFSIALGSPGFMQLVGVYYLSRPLGLRCTQKYGGDLMVLTERGVFPISLALQSATVDKRVAITDKIEPAFVANAQALFSTFGWQMELNTQFQFLLVNVPSSPPTQFVMQLQTRGWSNFTNWNANCFIYFNGAMYFGSTNAVLHAYTGSSDNGNQISTVILPAFTQLKIPGQQKHVKLVRPYFSANGNFSFAIGAATDYLVPYAPNAPQAVSTTLALWDVALWDQGLWASLNAQTKLWTTVASWPCVAFAPFFQIATNSAQIMLEAYDIVFAEGGVL